LVIRFYKRLNRLSCFAYGYCFWFWELWMKKEAYGKVQYGQRVVLGWQETYFLDFKRTANDTLFIQITRSDRKVDGSFVRNHVIVFEEDLPSLIRGLSSLCHHAAHVDEMPPRVVSNAVAKGIAAMPLEQRPREKLFREGAAELSDAELLAILLGTGSADESVLELSKRLLHAFGGLDGLARASCERLQLFTGIGEAKSAMVVAVMELSKRVQHKY
jgi:hypothetical protein